MPADHADDITHVIGCPDYTYIDLASNRDWRILLRRRDKLFPSCAATATSIRVFGRETASRRPRSQDPPVDDPNQHGAEVDPAGD